MALTMSFTDTLVVVTCWCGINHAIPQDLDDFQSRQHRDGVKQLGIYCPLGHTHVRAGEGEAARLQREKEQAEARAARRLAALDQERSAREAAERSASAYKGQATRARKRAAAALCPVEGCGRSFVQIRRHLTAKHPDYTAPAADAPAIGTA